MIAEQNNSAIGTANPEQPEQPEPIHPHRRHRSRGSRSGVRQRVRVDASIGMVRIEIDRD